MSSETVATRRRLAWLVPLAVAGAVAGGAVVATAGPSDAAPVLPPLTAKRLLTRTLTHAGDIRAFSGTVREVTALGLPDLPGDLSQTSWSWQTFVTGSHRLRIAVDGPARQRVALLGQLAEADVIHDGRNLWTYTSETNTVTHAVLPRPAGRAANDVAPANLTPPAVVSRLLQAVRPSTALSVKPAQRVAGRAAYTLVIRPRDPRTTVRKVTLAIDARTFMPLQVQVFGAGTSPAFQTGFTSIDFSRPAASTFSFTPPAGAIRGAVPFGRSSSEVGRASSRPVSPSHSSVIGRGWTTVVKIGGLSGRSGPAALGPLAEASTPVGTRGDRLVHTALINALIRADGTVLVGAVRPGALEHVAAGH